MLNTQNIDLVFTQGADNKTESKNVLGNKATIADNIRYDKIGAAIPRGGVSETVITSSIAGDTSPAFGTLADTNTNLQMSRGSLYRVVNNSPVLAGSELRGDVRRKLLGNCSTSRLSSASTGSTICTAWLDTTYLVSEVYQLSGPVVAQVKLNLAFTPISIVTLYASSNFYVIIQGTYLGTPQFQAYRINTTAAEVEGIVWTPPTVTSVARWDACSDGTNIYLHYAVNSATSTTLAKIVPTGTTWVNSTSVTALTFSGTSKGLACLSPSSMSGVAVVVSAGEDGGNGKAAFFNSSLGQVGTTQSISNTSRRAQLGYLAQINSTTVEAGFSGADSTNTTVIHTAFRATTSTVQGVTRIQTIDALPLTQGFFSDNRSYQLMDTITEPTYGSQAILEWEPSSGLTCDPAFILGVSKNLGNQDITAEYTLPKPLNADGKFVLSGAFVGSTTGLEAGSPGTNAIALAAKATSQNQASVVIVDPLLYRTGIIDRTNHQSLAVVGTPRLFNSNRAVGGPWPETSMKIGTNRLDIDTGTAMPDGAGTYSFVFAKVIKMANGQVYRIYSPIFVANVTTGAIRHKITNADVGVAGGNIGFTTELEYYRTEKNGQVFYLATSFDTPLTYTDAIADSILIKNRLADINGEELPPEITSGARIATMWRERVALVSADSGTTIKFNKPVQYPIGTCFAPGLEIDVGNEGGDITGLGQMDSPLYIFKRNQIHYLYGDPPGATGGGSTLNTPLLFKNGIGCSNSRSVVETPEGLIFGSDKGFQMIRRNQEITFIGQGPYADRAELVTGAAVDRDQAEVYFSYEDGVVWVYNYELNSWYRWSPTSDCKGVAIHDGVLVASTQSGYWTYSKLLGLDVLATQSNQITTDFQTGWFRMSGIRGFQRAKRLYVESEVLASCDLTVEVYVNYSTTPSQVFTESVSTSSRHEIDLHLTRQKCEAIQFRFKTNQKGMKWLGATLEIGVKQGGDKSGITT